MFILYHIIIQLTIVRMLNNSISVLPAVELLRLALPLMPMQKSKHTMLSSIRRIVVLIFIDNRGEIEVNLTKEQIHILAQIMLPDVLAELQARMAKKQKAAEEATEEEQKSDNK